MDDTLHVLYSVIIIGFFLFLWIAMLIHAIKYPIRYKVLWIVVLILTNLFSAVFYYFIVYKKSEERTSAPRGSKKGAILIISSIILLIIISLALLLSYRPPSSNGLKEVPLSEVVRQSNNGEIRRIEIKGNEIIILKKGDPAPSLRSRKAIGSSLHEQGVNTKGIEVIIKD